jgi:hypothetical protein
MCTGRAHRELDGNSKSALTAPQAYRQNVQSVTGMAGADADFDRQQFPPNSASRQSYTVHTHRPKQRKHSIKAAADSNLNTAFRMAGGPRSRGVLDTLCNSIFATLRNRVRTTLSPRSVEGQHQQYPAGGSRGLQLEMKAAQTFCAPSQS